MNIRSLTSALFFRSQLADAAGRSFAGKRDLFKALGYDRLLTPAKYRDRYRRNEVANRIVKALPKATWRAGAEIIEDEDPTTETPFEKAFIDLDHRLKIWDKFKRTDILAGIGRYAIILIGAPGALDTPLESASADDIAYLTPYAEEDAMIETFDIDIQSPRFGLPMYYTVKRTSMSNAQALNSAVVGRRVHFTRVHHVADGLLDDNIYGEPRLECVWNRLDDLEKVAGGGAEAFWRRADRGMQFDLDPTLELGEGEEAVAEKARIRNQIEEYEHGLRRFLLTHGMKVSELGSDVADFKTSVESIMSLISTGCDIPQRVLMGSEQGKLAAKQDRASWDNRVTDRQNEWAGPCVVRPFVDRLIELGALPSSEDFEVRFSSITTMDDEQRSKIAGEWAGLNSAAGQTVVTGDEIRERVLQLPPLALPVGGVTAAKSDTLANELTNEDFAIAERIVSAALNNTDSTDNDLQTLRDVAVKLAAKPAPAIYVTVQAPPTLNKKIIRDAKGLAVGVVTEDA
jgi:hypothetical protein